MNFDLLLSQLAAMRNQIDAMMEIIDGERQAQGLPSGLSGPTGTEEDDKECQHPGELENGAPGRVNIGTLATGEQFMCRSCGEIIKIETFDDLSGAQGNQHQRTPESVEG